MILLPILLPEGFKATVTVGEKITSGQVIAEKKDKAIEEVIHVSQIFKIPPHKMPKIVKKNLGDGVSKGDILAIEKGPLGFGNKKIISEFSGTIIKIDSENGDVLIHTASTKENKSTFISPVDGTVDFCDNNKIVVKTEKDAVMAIRVSGKETRGELFVFEDEDVDFSEISQTVEKKIILGKTFAKGAIFKAFGLGALAVIGVKIRESDFEDLEEKAIESPVFQVSEGDFEKLKKNLGKQVFLDPENKCLVVL